MEPSAATNEFPLIRFYEPQFTPANTTNVKILKADLDRFEHVPFTMKGLVITTSFLEASGAASKEFYGSNTIQPAASKMQKKLTKLGR